MRVCCTTPLEHIRIAGGSHVWPGGTADAHNEVGKFFATDRVLDFFAGSGTTAQAVVELNNDDGGTRSFHLVQIPEPTSPRSAAHRAGFSTVADICIERVRKVPGASFHVYRPD